MLIPHGALAHGVKHFFLNELPFPEGLSVKVFEAQFEDRLILIVPGTQGFHHSGLK